MIFFKRVTVDFDFFFTYNFTHFFKTKFARKSLLLMCLIIFICGSLYFAYMSMKKLLYQEKSVFYTVIQLKIGPTQRNCLTKS